MKLFIIQQRQALVPSNVLKVAFSKYVLTELRHFYLIALLFNFKNFDINLLLWRVVTTVSVHRLADSPGKRI